jgi:tetratricopeptide (TPR) repeat protein
LALYARSLALFREVGDTAGFAWTLHNCGDAAAEQGDATQAESLYRESLALFQRLGDTENCFEMRAHLADLARHRGDDEQAAGFYAECIAYGRKTGLTRQTAWWLTNLAHALQNQGRYDESSGLYKEGLELLHGMGDRLGIARCLEGLAQVACLQKQPERAARICGAAAVLRTSVGAPLPLPERPDWERAIAIARAALGGEGYASAWSRGQALSLKDAIDEALERNVHA